MCVSVKSNPTVLVYDRHFLSTRVLGILSLDFKAFFFFNQEVILFYDCPKFTLSIKLSTAKKKKKSDISYLLPGNFYLFMTFVFFNKTFFPDQAVLFSACAEVIGEKF